MIRPLACAAPALLLLLSSCSAEQPQATQTATDDGTTAPAKAGAPAATPAAPPKAGTEVPPLTAEGWGPLRIGMTLAEVTAAVGPDANPEAVGGPDPAACDEFHPARAPAYMMVTIEDGRLTRISIGEGATVKTDRGLGIGAPASAVRAAYGAALIAEPHKYTEPPAEYLTIWSGAKPSAYVDDAAARGVRYNVETTRKVAEIHAGGPSIQYVEGCL